jgi:hypothetical protein
MFIAIILENYYQAHQQEEVLFTEKKNFYLFL